MRAHVAVQNREEADELLRTRREEIAPYANH